MSSITCCSCWPSLTQKFSSSKESRRYRRAKYNEREYTIEFENLIEEEDFYAPKEHAVSEVERELINKGKYGDLFNHQRDLMRQEEEILLEKEEKARLEDEAYIQAKREASRVARQAMKKGEKAKFPNLSNFDSVEFSKWLSEENIDITSPELDIEDFESFLEKVRSKSNQRDYKAKLFEQTLSQGLAATKIAGDALNALQPVELHAVDMSANIIPIETSNEEYCSNLSNSSTEKDVEADFTIVSEPINHISDDLKPVELQSANTECVSDNDNLTYDPFQNNIDISKETEKLSTPSLDDLICTTPDVQFKNQSSSYIGDTVVQINTTQYKPAINLSPVEEVNTIPIKDFEDDSLAPIKNASDIKGHSEDSLDIVDDFDDDFVSSNVNAAFEDIL